MKAQDLRIGNLVYRENSKLINQKTDVYSIENVNLQSAQKYEPIPLTEEWLLRMGLTKNGREEFEFKRYRLYQTVSYVNFLFCEGNLVLREIKYVHTLQNLIHSLTGEELTIK